jgi:uncharacterized protein (TIGR00730 family)
MEIFKSKNIMRLCILGGFDDNTSPLLQNQAEDLALAMAGAHIGLTCMGNAGALITRIAQVTKAHGGNVICVLPPFFTQNERLRDLADEQMPAKDLHEIKLHLFNLSAGVIVLPGDIGTLDILLEYLTWMQRVHQSSKPVYLVNEGLFWESLLQVFVRMQNESFLPKDFHTRYKLVAELRHVLPDFQSIYLQ